MGTSSATINAVDLFCGVGGLSYGLAQAGIRVRGGVDIDEQCQFAFEQNNNAKYHLRDIREVSGEQLLAMYPKSGLRLLAGCAPCQPFSRHMRGADTSADKKWTLLDEFGRLVNEVQPDFVTMENVTGIARTPVFNRFIAVLRGLGYFVDFKSSYGPRYGLPQHRRRLVLVASRLGEIRLPKPKLPATIPTVREAIGSLPALASGEQCASDPLHRARKLTPLNIARLKASKPGGSWLDWPEELRADCHRRSTGSTFKSVYARMSWDEPAPTITTQAFNFGTGRFGHPTQDRALSLREAAILQGFPQDYAFIPKEAPVQFTHMGRLIGNAVPPPLGRAIGRILLDHANAHRSQAASRQRIT